MNVLMLGDVFGRAGRNAIIELLPSLRKKRNIDLVIANAENAAGGKGLTPETARQLLDNGVNILTLGNHFRDQASIDDELQNNPSILRPWNYPEDTPGKGYAVFQNGNHTIGVVNLIGRVHMMEVRSPFEKLQELIDEIRSKTPFIFVDFHAEATSEKRAMGFFLNGKVTAIVGTHTHVQTADEQILSEGTAYITDLGMTGPHDSVIGLETEIALARFAKFERKEFQAAEGNPRLNGLLIGVEEVSGKSTSVERINIGI